MMEKQIGMCRDFIIHPGETLQNLIDERHMSQKELALRCGFSEKHVSKVLNEQAGITPKFAKALECVFGVSAEFWMNRQTDYEIELLEYEKDKNISDEEVSILSNLKDIIKYLCETGSIKPKISKKEQVLRLREIFGINNLTTIPSLAFNCAYRGSKRHPIDPYVLFAWQRLCEIEAEKQETVCPLDIKKLQDQIPDIRAMALKDITTVRAELQHIFSDCGVKFCIVKHFSGAPVQGFIEQTRDGEIILCMTIRYAFADIFWFTLFHEISHILNGDYKKRFLDFTFTENDVENAANEFAANTLIPPHEYATFIRHEDYTLPAIQWFARQQEIPVYIVIGRLQKEMRISQSSYAAEKVRYKWI